MQFYLSYWFTVSRLPAIIPTFDLTWKLMRQMSIFLWEAKFRREKKNGWEKNKLGELSTKEIQEITDNAVPVKTKRPKKFGLRVFNASPYPSLKSCKVSNMDIENSWRLRNNNNNFYLNVSEWLVSSGGTKFSKPIEKMSKEELNVIQKRFCASARKKDGTLSVYFRFFLLVKVLEFYLGVH